MDPDPFGRPFASDETKTLIADALAAIPQGKRGALLVRADSQGFAIAQVAARLGDSWKVAAGAGAWIGKRPSGYVAVEASW